MSEEYTDVHSAFLQVCANRGTLNLSSALGALVHIKNRCKLTFIFTSIESLISQSEGIPLTKENCITLTDGLNKKIIFQMTTMWMLQL